MEFFSREIRQPDDELLNTLAAVGRQIGQVLERRRVEDEIRDSEQKWRQLAQTAPDVILSVTRDGTIRLINRPVAGAKSVDELIGTNCYSYIPPEQHELFRKSVE